MTPTYRCTACGARWTYAAIRHLARCRHCEAGLTRDPAAPERTPVQGRRSALEDYGAVEAGGCSVWPLSSLRFGVAD